MNLILYVHKNSAEKGDSLKRQISQQLTNHNIQIIQTVNDFKTRLKQVFIDDNNIFILFADSKRRLNELTSLIDLVESKRIVIILPDKSEATLTSALKFFPRYFSYINETYDDLCAVLLKMTQQEKP